MKKNYFLAILMVFAMVSLNAQFTDDMESYTAGSPISGAHWTDWGCGGGSGCAIMASNTQAHSGSISGYIPDDGTTDAVLDFGNKIFGQWGLEFWMYVPAGKVGYFNIQGTVPVASGEFPVGNIYFNRDNTNPGLMEMDDAYNDDANPGCAFNAVTGAHEAAFPHDQWFKIQMNWDISAGMSVATWEFIVNDVVVIEAGTHYGKDSDEAYVPTSLGGFDLYSISVDNQAYFDDFVFQNSFVDTSSATCSTSSVSDLEAKGFNFYPNPVKNELNLNAQENISSVSIYNVIGQQVKNVQPNALTSVIDMSDLESGAYFVKVAIGDSVGTIKVIK